MSISILEASEKLHHGDPKGAAHDDRAHEPSLGGQHRPGKHKQPEEECCDDQQQHTTEPGQIARLDQSEKEHRTHHDHDQPARQPVEDLQDPDTASFHCRTPRTAWSAHTRWQVAWGLAWGLGHGSSDTRYLRAVSELLGDSSAPILLVINRFRVTTDQSATFAEHARLALATLGESVGFIDGAIAQATDETDLRLITTRWKDVGSYRRALSRFEVKISAVPLLSQAIDESSAFEAVHVISGGVTTSAASGRAADADVIGLGSAASAAVPPVQA